MGHELTLLQVLPGSPSQSAAAGGEGAVSIVGAGEMSSGSPLPAPVVVCNWLRWESELAASFLPEVHVAFNLCLLRRTSGFDCIHDRGCGGDYRRRGGGAG